MSVIAIYDATAADEADIRERLGETKHKLEFISQPISLDNLRPDAEVAAVFVSSQVTGEMLARMPKLKLVVCRSTGFDNVDLAAAQARNISVVNVPTYGEHTVAEYAFGLLLTLTRKLVPAIEQAREGAGEHHSVVGLDLYGRTFGLLGAGRIGRSAAGIAAGFGMKVIAYDPYPNQREAARLGFKYVSLDELAESSDVISLHAPATPENHHIVSDKFLHRVKPGAILINTARGELVDTNALIGALQEGRLGGAGLDVVEGEKLMLTAEELQLLRTDSLDVEPLRHNLEINVLMKLSNVVVTRHNAYNTVEAVRRINYTSADNILNYFKGSPTNVISGPKPVSGQLVLVRHAESEWNAIGIWTGTKDIHLSPKGRHESELLGKLLEDIKFDRAYYSEQVRTLETLDGIRRSSGQGKLTGVESGAINERDYGVYTGKNKWEVMREIGEDSFQKLRRGWDYPVPKGEMLKDVYWRAVPYYTKEIVPRLLKGENILLVAHGNSIRSLVKYIENISDTDIANIDMIFGKALIYTVNAQGRMMTKAAREIDTTPPPA